MDPTECSEFISDMKLYDVTLPIRTGMIAYPGDPGAKVTPRTSIRAGNNSNTSYIEISSHAGTHVDAPFHFENDGIPVDEVPLDLLIGPARLLPLEGKQRIEAEDLRNADLGAHKRLLIKTSNSMLLKRAETSLEYVSLTESGARYVVELGIKLLGIDYLSVEKVKSAGSPVHHTLLGSGMVLIETLDLSEPAPGDYELICLPLRIAGCDGAPARVVLRGPM